MRAQQCGRLARRERLQTVVKIAKPTIEISDKVRLNLEKFV